MSALAIEINELNNIITNINVPSALCSVLSMRLIHETASKAALAQTASDVDQVKADLFELFAKFNDDIAMLHPMIRKACPDQLALVYDYASSLINSDASIDSLSRMNSLLSNFSKLSYLPVVN